MSDDDDDIEEAAAVASLLFWKSITLRVLKETKRLAKMANYESAVVKEIELEIARDEASDALFK